MDSFNELQEPRFWKAFLLLAAFVSSGIIVSQIVVRLVG